MTNMKDFSEIQEAAKLFAQLMRPAVKGSKETVAGPLLSEQNEAAPESPAPLTKAAEAVVPEATQAHEAELEVSTPSEEIGNVETPVVNHEVLGETFSGVTVEQPELGYSVQEVPEPEVHVARASASFEASLEGTSYRGEMLERVLEVMCRRSGFKGAVIADNTGLPLAVYNSPVSTEALAAFTSVLGDALIRASSLLCLKEANNISIDINYEDKIVLMQFKIQGANNFMMVICGQEIDVRSEMEVSIDQVISILS